jgi:hypothetical protein
VRVFTTVHHSDVLSLQAFETELRQGGVPLLNFVQKRLSDRKGRRHEVEHFGQVFSTIV